MTWKAFEETIKRARTSTPMPNTWWTMMMMKNMYTNLKFWL